MHEFPPNFPNRRPQVLIAYGVRRKVQQFRPSVFLPPISPYIINIFRFLLLAVPPQKPTIIDEKGKEVPSVAGPYDEGGDMKLTCIVTGGKFITFLSDVWYLITCWMIFSDKTEKISILSRGDADTIHICITLFVLARFYAGNTFYKSRETSSRDTSVARPSYLCMYSCSWIYVSLVSECAHVVRQKLNLFRALTVRIVRETIFLLCLEYYLAVPRLSAFQ